MQPIMSIKDFMTMARLWCCFSRPEFIAGIDIVKGVRLVVERHLGHAHRRIPGVDLAPAALEEKAEVFEHALAREAEHGLRLVAGPGHREVRTRAVEPRIQARD